MTSFCSTDHTIVWLCSTPIDWSATGDFLSGIGTVAGAGAVIFAAIKGVDAYQLWRLQKREERRMELAEQILTISYKIKEAFRLIRSVGGFGHEHTAAEEELNRLELINEDTDKGQKDRLIMAQVIIGRIQKNGARFDELLELLPMVKVVFGGAVEEAFDSFVGIRWTVIAAARSYGRYKVPEFDSKEKADESDAYLRQLEKTFWEGASEEDADEVRSLVNQAIKTLEDKLLPIIRIGLDA